MGFHMIVPEIDILEAAVRWLWRERKVWPYQFSIASGQGINYEEHKKRLLNLIEDEKIPNLRTPNFVSNGPDIIGVWETEYWVIECKGSGSGKSQTQRNNFDRALASVVSYYTDVAPKYTGAFEVFNNAIPHLGLAMPNTKIYYDLLRKRVRSPLRKALNLWILLYNVDTKTIQIVSPEKDYNKIT
ncbi:MAG: hypothetical protein HQ568_06795 [Calditrichaeota bacterium]|nr:hypothetical protein [Calditrichota bacterium]